MTPNTEQIKKGLECCFMQELEHNENCPECPYTDLYPNCFEYLGKHALAVINSQEQRIGELTEENERLKSEVSVKRKLLDKAEVRIDCLDEVNKVLKADICNATMNLEHITKENDRLKADTVREMQTIIEEKADSCDICLINSNKPIDIIYQISKKQLDQIAKEMLEDENER